MAGTQQGFNAAQFIDAVRFAMYMGMPDAVADRPTFLFAPVRTYPPGTRLDQAGNPLDPRVRPVVVTPPPIRVLCAIQFGTATPEELPGGEFRPTRATITLLEQEYQQIRNAVEVLLGGDRYRLSYRVPPVGMFSVTIHQFLAYGLEEV